MKRTLRLPRRIAYLLRGHEIALREAEVAKTEILQGSHDTRGIFGGTLEPDVEITCLAGAAMDSHGISDDDEVSSLVGVE